jgi:hypothetical protein
MSWPYGQTNENSADHPEDPFHSWTPCSGKQPRSEDGLSGCAQRELYRLLRYLSWPRTWDPGEAVPRTAPEIFEGS